MNNFFLTLYVIASFFLFIISMNCYVMTLLFKRRNKKAFERDKLVLQQFHDEDVQWPSILTQLPIFNEYNVAERIIKAACALEYPGRHEIQVLDDSTDDTKGMVSKFVAQLQDEGFSIVHLHREHRQGFKAGALSEGMRESDCKLIAIFDADFIPERDFFLKTVPYLAVKEDLGLVQARWGHINRDESMLTRIQAIGIDGHFAVEQGARDWNDLYLNFNGTAGIWRRQAIEDAGGWQWDTLTEDMDLSYRMQFAGWKTHYLIDVECPAELPEDINSFKSQQFRWAKGSIQTALKIFPGVLRDSEAGLFKKFQALMHTTHYSIHPLMLMLSVLALPVLVYSKDFNFFGIDLSLLYGGIFLCSVAPSTLYAVSQKRLYPDSWLGNLKVLPALMCIGTGLALSNSRAVFEALAGKESPFVRTPKKGDSESKQYRIKLPWVPFFEIALGLYCVYSLMVYMEQGRWFVGPFLFVYSCGFLYVGILSLLHSGFWRFGR